MHDLPERDEEETEEGRGEDLTESEIVTKRKCPHCGGPLEIAAVIDLQQSVSIRVKGAMPKLKAPAKPEDEAEPVN